MNSPQLLWVGAAQLGATATRALDLSRSAANSDRKHDAD